VMVHLDFDALATHQEEQGYYAYETMENNIRN